MQVKYNGKNEKLMESVEFINDLFTLDSFYEEISLRSLCFLKQKL